MKLNVAVQMDPIARINIRGDSTFALLLEAQKFAALAKLKGLVIQLKVAETDHWHGKRGESTVG